MLSDLIKSKLVIVFFIFGLVLSLLMGLISGNPLPAVLIRMLLSGLIMGGIGIGIFLLLGSILSPEDMESLFRSSKAEQQEMSSSKDDQTGSKFDVTDDSELNPLDLFDSSNASPQSSTEPSEEQKKPVTSLQDTAFQEMDFAESAPKIQPIETFAATPQSSFSKSVPRSSGRGGSTKIKVNNQSLEVDPETMAKAIRTVLSKD